MSLPDIAQTILPADHVPVSVHLKGRVGMAVEWWPRVPATLTPFRMKVCVIAGQHIGAARFCGKVREDGQHVMAQVWCLWSEGDRCMWKGSSTFPLCSHSNCQGVISGALVFQGRLLSSCWSASSVGSLENKTSLVSHHHGEILPSWTLGLALQLSA